MDFMERRATGGSACPTPAGGRRMELLAVGTRDAAKIALIWNTRANKSYAGIQTPGLFWSSEGFFLPRSQGVFEVVENAVI